MKKGVLVAVLVALIIGVVVAGVILDLDSWRSCGRLRADLEGARAVTMEEYVRGKTIARKVATPDEIVRLQNASRTWRRPFYPDVANCFVPHHDLEITRSNGSKVIVQICFLCGQFGFQSDEKPVAVALPPSLSGALTVFFTSVGMKPKTYEEYRDIEVAASQSDQTQQQ